MDHTPPTSAAKGSDPLPEDYFNSPDLGAEYEEALDALEPIERSEEPGPAEPRNREGLEGTSLADAADMGGDFDEAAHASDEPDHDEEATRPPQEQAGSQMVQDQSLDPFPSIDNPIKDEVHRETFDEQWDAEIERAAADPDYMAAVEQAAQAAEQATQGQDHQQGMGR